METYFDQLDAMTPQTSRMCFPMPDFDEAFFKSNKNTMTSIVPTEATFESTPDLEPKNLNIGKNRSEMECSLPIQENV